MTKRDKNFKSFENLHGKIVDVGALEPKREGWTKWEDTMKTFQCENCAFIDALIKGGDEDCLDVGTHCNLNQFARFGCSADGGKYIVTLKSHSENNTFVYFHVYEHGSECDIQLGNWSDQDNGSNSGNVFTDWTSEDGKPITYSYRFFADSKPEFINTNAKHLWWLSAGVTIYFWGKWLWKKTPFSK